MNNKVTLDIRPIFSRSKQPLKDLIRNNNRKIIHEFWALVTTLFTNLLQIRNIDIASDLKLLILIFLHLQKEKNRESCIGDDISRYDMFNLPYKKFIF